MANYFRLTSETGALMGLFNRHLTKVAERTLINTPVLYEFADKHPLPGKSGKTLFVPRHISQNLIATLTEGTPVAICSHSAGYYSASVSGFGAAVGYSDFLEMVREIPTTITHDIEDMVKNGANKVDSLIRVKLCGTSTYVQPDGSTASGAVKSTTNLKQRFLFDAFTTLAGNNVPMYGDGLYWGAFHPRQVHDLFVNTSGSGQLATYKGSQQAGFLENTDVGARKLERFDMGVLGGVRIFKSTNTPVLTGAAAVGPISADNSGFQAFVMGPGAVGAVDLATARMRSYIKGLGSAGTADPIDQRMTVGVKFYFTAIAKDVATRSVRTGSGKTL